MALKQFLETAVEAARAAEEVIRHYYRRGIEVRLKADRSPVTEADVESERAIRRVLGEAFPDHGYFGEELGCDDAERDYLWLIDPIDGTKSFIRGYPFFSTQIALMHRGELVVGVSNAPAWGELATAARGLGARINGHPVAVSEIDQLERATLSAGNIATLAGDEAAWQRYGQLVRRVDRIRGYGDFCHYHLLASGSLDVVVESDVNILDIAALTVIVCEAGGRLTDLHGGPIGLDTTSVLASNGRLHDATLAAL
ncbi:MAG: inositol monophosphatase family protein [Gammaproteobacteria bacterium]|jgi:histidinol-phosphatase